MAKEGKVLEQKIYCSLSWEPLGDLKWVVLFVFPQVHLQRSTLIYTLALFKKYCLNHVENIYFPGTFEYECDVCGEKLDTRDKLRNHLSRDHNGKNK